MERRLAAILAADVVGYSRLIEADEGGTIAAFKAAQTELIDGRIAEHKGRLFKLTGDGMLVEFPSVINAVACAAAIQRGMRERGAALPSESRIEFRVGINVGDVAAENGDIFGEGVIVAARLESIAEPGGIAISESAREHVGNRLDLVFEDLGEQNLKNMARPIRAYKILLDAAEPAGAREPAFRKKDRPSIVVLPFKNMSGDPEQEYFSDGITEDLITDLSKIAGLYVVARHTAFSYANKSVTVKQVVKELGVAFVLEGSVRKAGTRVRITGQLISGENGDHVWAERFDRELTDIFAIQDEITHAIVEQLRIKLQPQELSSFGKARTANVEAYTYYLRGRKLLHRGAKSYYQLARRMFARAVELDPDYARAYAGIADCDSFLYLQSTERIAIAGILETSAKAIALDDNLAEAHASRGFALALGQRFGEAVVEFEKAIALNPNSFEAHYFYGRGCVVQGEREQAVAHFERAAEIKPDDYQCLCLMMPIYQALGRDAESKHAARRGIERAERALELQPDNPRPAYLGASALVVLGEVARAKEWISTALAIDPHDMLTQYNSACVYAGLGEIELALNLLEKSLPHGIHDWAKWIRHDSDLDSLRSHPRFQSLLEKVE